MAVFSFSSHASRPEIGSPMPFKIGKPPFSQFTVPHHDARVQRVDLTHGRVEATHESHASNIPGGSLSRTTASTARALGPPCGEDSIRRLIGGQGRDAIRDHHGAGGSFAFSICHRLVSPSAATRGRAYLSYVGKSLDGSLGRQFLRRGESVGRTGTGVLVFSFPKRSRV